METEVLRELIQKQEPMVIALGGGLPIGGNLYGEEPVRQRALLRGERNRELLAELGYVFYLKITPEEVYRRLNRAEQTEQNRQSRTDRAEQEKENENFSD